MGGRGTRRAPANHDRTLLQLGPDAYDIADEYIRHNYRDEYLESARADTMTTAEQIQSELRRLSEAGRADVMMFPCSDDLGQVALLANPLEEDA